ncbi:MAG: NCS2 family permease [Proteobacteria bacterium]|jgi:AGZA family xanthine/uracil permease-like MFS transporter|nr:NCS2 family permease [Pseudomonadota bacterium]
MTFSQLFTFHKTKISYPQEIIGGIANFMAIAYIIILNPVIMNANGKGFPISPTVTATIISIVIMTTIAAFLIKLPFILAPGMGLNTMVSYTLAVHDKLPTPIVLGIIFWSSVLLLIFSVTNLRQKIINVIPLSIQTGLSVGIGLLLILIGIKNAHVIISNPETLLSMNRMNVNIILCFLGFILASVLFIKGKMYAMILPIIIITVISILNGSSHLPHNLITMPDFSLFLKIDFLGSLKLSILPAILSLFLVNFFDATSSVIGLLSQLEYNSNESKQLYNKRALLTDAIGGIISGIAGTAPSAVFVESSVGIHNGAKTGFASIVTAVICIPFLFISPVISIIPNIATSPILILVGILMVKNIRNLNLVHLEDFIAVILTIIMMPLCFSITAGAVVGIISYTILKLLLGKFKEVNPGLIILALCCSGWFTI